MKLYQLLTAVALSTVLSTSAFAGHSGHVGSGGEAEGGAFVQGSHGKAISVQNVETVTAHDFTKTDALSVSAASVKWGTLAVGGSASAGSGSSSGH